MTAEAQQKAGTHFYQIELCDIETVQYALAADYGGSAFEKQACRAASEQLAADAVNGMKEKITEGKSMWEETTGLGSLWEKARSAQKEAEEYEEKEEKPDQAVEGQKQEPAVEPQIDAEHQLEPLPENPMTYVELLQKSSLLAVVLEQPSELSGKAFRNEDTLEKRKRYCGNMEQIKTGAVDKLWFQQYLSRYFSCKTSPKENRVLDYELEYCIAGRSTDRENLESVVKKLLLIREAGNFATIMKDAEKKTLAMEIAAAAVGFTGMVPLVKAVQIGILLAWCYIESILDVKSLLAGGAVKLIKGAQDWQSDLFHLNNPAENVGNKRQEKDGMNYQEYLQILLFLTGEETLVYRAMDMAECNIRLLPGKSQFRIDTMAAAVEMAANYTASPLFLNFFGTIPGKVNGYYFQRQRKFSYIT